MNYQKAAIQSNAGRILDDKEKNADYSSYPPLSEPLINCLRGMKRKAHGAQEPRHINRIVEVASTAQRSDSPAQTINQRFTSLISVLIPVYNVEEYLRQCLDSIVNQTYRNIEIVCVNDASPDNSLVILNEYAKKDSRIIIINKKENEGLPQARKTGFEHSSGEYIIPIDSDDWVEPDMLEKMANAAFAQNYDMVCCGYYQEYKGTVAMNAPSFSRDKIERIRFGCIDGTPSSAAVWNKLIKREVYEKIIFPSEYLGEDGFITCQTLYYSENIGIVPKSLYHYRIREKSISTDEQKIRRNYEDARAIFSHIIKFCTEKFGHGASVLEHDFNKKIAWIEIKLNPYRSIAVQELAVLQQFLRASPVTKIKEAYDIIAERVKLNIEMIQGTDEAYLSDSFEDELKTAKWLLKRKEDVLTVQPNWFFWHRYQVFIRQNTSDTAEYDMVIRNNQYNFLTSEEPGTIIDAAGNIGLATVYFAEKYPNTKIIAIEPDENNFRFLQKNTEAYPNVVAINAALWDNEDEMENLLGNNAINSIDILKMDITDAEKEVFSNCRSWIKNVRSIIVTHGEKMKERREELLAGVAAEFDEISYQNGDVYLSKVGFIRHAAI